LRCNYTHTIENMKAIENNLSAMRGMNETERKELGRKHTRSVKGACLILGKLLAVVAEKIEEGKSKSKAILDALGLARSDVPSVAFSVAVCCKFVSDDESNPATFSESALDEMPTESQAIASAVYNLLDKAKGTAADGKASEADKQAAQAVADKADGWRADVAKVFRDKPSDHNKRLKAIRDAVKGNGGESEAETGKGGGNGKEAGLGVLLDDMPPNEAALICLKGAAKYLAKAALDAGQCERAAAMLADMSAIVALKAKTAEPAPVANVGLVDGTLQELQAAPAAPVAPAPVGEPQTALAAALAAATPSRKRGGRRAAAMKAAA